MRKQFDLQYYIEHPETKVVARDGRDVRILCTDLKNECYPIVASLINHYSHEEEPATYTREGKALFGTHENYAKDIFFDFPDPLKETDATTKIKELPTDDMINKIVKLTITWLYNQCLEHDNPTAFEFVKKHLKDE